MLRSPVRYVQNLCSTNFFIFQIWVGQTDGGGKKCERKSEKFDILDDDLCDDLVAVMPAVRNIDDNTFIYL